MLGKSIKTGYQSHYVITTKRGKPFTDRDYERNDPFDELILDQEAQVVPIFLLTLMDHDLRRKSFWENPSDDCL